MGQIKFSTSLDPRRWNADPNEERRWEKSWQQGKKMSQQLEDTGQQLSALVVQASQLQAVIDQTPNTTNAPAAGSPDAELKLSGTRILRGKRTRSEVPEDEFTEWYTQVKFDTPFPAPPVVLLTVEEYGDAPPALTGTYALTLHNVSASGFYFRLAVSPAQLKATVHWRAEGNT